MLGSIQLVLSHSDLGLAANLAKKQLGMSSLSLYGSHGGSRFTAPAMRESGTGKNQSAKAGERSGNRRGRRGSP